MTVPTKSVPHPCRVDICEGDAAEPIIRLFEGIALAENWQPGDQFRAHAGRSIYLGLWKDETLGGGMQLILPDGEGHIPSHLVWPELPQVGEESRHAAVLAVLPEYRRIDHAAAFWSLCVALWRYGQENNVTTLWLEATPKMLRCYRLLGWPLVVEGELRQHGPEQT
jgi:hypothetical protein